MSWISRLKDPMPMQGTLSRPHFFEGWYYRMVAPTGESISLIPGYSTAHQDPHSFLQYIIAAPSQADPSGRCQGVIKTGYLRFPLQQFQDKHHPFQIKIGDSHFTRDRIEVHAETEEIKLHGNISCQNMTPIKTSLFHPNIMGWFAYVPGMECYHGVISMGHQLEGRIELDGCTIDCTGGRGYLEKDWGTSFPKSYVWIQCNQFQSDQLQSGQVSLMCSVAEIPFLGTRFQGHIINLVVDDREYRFATYNRSKIRSMQLQDDEVTILADHPCRSLRIHARLDLASPLKAPRLGQMDRIIKEGLQGTVEIELRDKRSGVMFQCKGINAGIEMIGY